MRNPNAARTCALLLALLPLSLSGQEVPDSGPERRTGPRGGPVPVLEAVPVDGPGIRVDGLLDEPAWRDAAVATDFVQFQPDEGEPASERTEARVLYGDDALYVGMRAWDSEPSRIVGQLTRRDQGSYSDRLMVAIDSYHDLRTAFLFGVNPVGVKMDVYYFDDTQEDSSWDAVWDVETAIDGEGWTAEFRIPYSQLRFGSEPVQTWGINFVRDIARHNEKDVWAPLSRTENRIISRSGELRNLRGLDAPRRVELMPYSLARMTNHTTPSDPTDPFYENTEGGFEVGGDLKYGVSSNLTLDLTVNPDFGQVEADPAQVNLTAFETFNAERRPFFIEGANIFNFRLTMGDGDGANEALFYSRRIGRTPQGSADDEGGWIDAPDRTRIFGAWKLSGKTSDGLSVGLLHAVTGQEEARVLTGAGRRHEVPVEPLTNYGVARVQQDFRDGRSAVGGILTLTNRDTETADALGIRSGAYTGGLDFRHRFGTDGNWNVDGSLMGSHVRGGAEAIETAQRSAARYFQRPDAEHLVLDPDRTSMSGWSAMGSIGKHAGGYWRFATGATARSPGFEPNDLGFMLETDYVSPFVWMGYHKSDPGEHLQRWNVNLNGWTGWTFGGERTSVGGNVNGSFTLKNYWGGYGGINVNGEGYSSGALRGGPLFRREPDVSGWFGINSDHRKPVQVSLNNNWGVRPASDSWRWNTSAHVGWRPSGAATVSAGPFVNRRVDDRQWVEGFDLPRGDEYLFGRIDQTTVGMTARMDYAFTPDLSLQVYAQPFVSAGTYDDFKLVADPRAEAYEDRFRGVQPAVVDGAYEADFDGDGATESWSDPDFNFKQFRSNVVLRWEYRPGSTLFVVWSQARDHSLDGDGRFSFTDDVGTLFEQSPEDVFMVKLSYWLNP